MKINTRQFRQWIYYLLIGLVSFEILIVVVYLGSILKTGVPYPPFDMNGGMTIPSLLQAAHFLVIGLISITLYWIERRRPVQFPSQFFKLGMTGLMFYATFDETFKIHLQFKNWFSGLGNQGWIGGYLLIFSLTPIILYQDFRSLWLACRRETILGLLGMIIFALGGFGATLFSQGLKHDLFQPLLSGVFQDSQFRLMFEENIRIALEEFLELLGENLILYGILLFMIQQKRNGKQGTGNGEQGTV